MELQYTDARPEDLPAIVATYNATIPSRLVTADLEPITVADRLAWFAAHHPDRRPLWCIHADGQYAGWLSFNSFYGRPAYDGTVEISIYLEPAFQGRGLGRKVLQRAIDECPRLQIQTLLGFIFGHNTPSLNLFYNMGFAQWALLPRIARMETEERDLVIVGKRVQE